MDLAYPFLCPASFEEPPRRRAARLETKRTHLPTQKHVCGALPYYPLSTPLPPHAALSQMSLLLFISLRCLFSLSLSLSLLLSLLLCFCDLFVSASRPIFNFFFSFSSRLPFSVFFFEEGVVGLAYRALPRTPNSQVHRASLNFALSRKKKERKITASHLYTRACLLSTSFRAGKQRTS